MVVGLQSGIGAVVAAETRAIDLATYLLIYMS
jgi:hypothetical protein